MISPRLIETSQITDQRDRIQAYKEILKEISARENQESELNSDSSLQIDAAISNFKEFLTHILHESVGLAISRNLITDFMHELEEISGKPTGVNGMNACHEKEILLFALDRMCERSTPFEEQIGLLRFRLANILEQEEDWSNAAKMLQGIVLDSGHRQVSDEYKLKIYNQIVRLYLEDEDDVNAEAYLNRMNHLIPASAHIIFSHSVTSADQENISNPEWLVQFKASQARLLDFKKQFLNASLKYFELSQIEDIHEEEQRAILEQSVICAILAQAGPLRNKQLATLYKDERSKLLSKCLSAILEKMYLERILETRQVAEFSQRLKSHQKAKLASGFTVLERAVIEHNILSASKIYRDMTYEGLSDILSISTLQTENVVNQMVSEKRLVAKMDGVKEIVYFEMDRVGSKIAMFDTDIDAVCHELDRVVDEIISF